ncbi:BRO-N domain-containing protein [Bacillus mycoides]|uniref:BRO-N domain-containing protein n=1 Tax=Bacillus TaxID=1386 RepID=UPI003D20079F
MNQFQTFSHHMFGNLEILIMEGKEYFPGTDVAKVLGYTNPHKAIRDHCKQEGVNETLVSLNSGKQMNEDGWAFCPVVF